MTSARRARCNAVVARAERCAVGGRCGCAVARRRGVGGGLLNRLRRRLPGSRIDRSRRSRRDDRDDHRPDRDDQRERAVDQRRLLLQPPRARHERDACASHVASRVGSMRGQCRPELRAPQQRVEAWQHRARVARRQRGERVRRDPAQRGDLLRDARQFARRVATGVAVRRSHPLRRDVRCVGLEDECRVGQRARPARGCAARVRTWTHRRSRA